MLQERLFIKHFSKQIILCISGVFIIASFIVMQHVFNKKINNKMELFEQEQQILIEQLNNKLLKSNKQLNVTKEENKNLHMINQSLEKKLKELQITKQDIEKEIVVLKEQNSVLIKSSDDEKNDFLQKINHLNKNKSDLEDLIKELQLQIKNHKDNTYSLFQAGKLEVELSSVEQQLSEQYDIINQKKNNLNYLKNKCGVLRTNSSFCQEYDNVVESVSVLEQHIILLKTKREDLKHRINSYLAASK